MDWPQCGVVGRDLGGRFLTSQQWVALFVLSTLPSGLVAAARGQAVSLDVGLGFFVLFGGRLMGCSVALCIVAGTQSSCMYLGGAIH